MDRTLNRKKKESKHTNKVMGRVYIEYFEGSQFYFCMDCKTHLTSKDELFSKVIK